MLLNEAVYLAFEGPADTAGIASEHKTPMIEMITRTSSKFMPAWFRAFMLAGSSAFQNVCQQESVMELSYTQGTFQ